MIKKKRLRSLLAVLTAAVLMVPVPAAEAKAAISVPLTLKQARTLAFANSRDYRKVSSSITLKTVEYIQAVKSIGLKKIDMATFRWTPLLSFKFPQKPDLSEAYEWQYKPLQLQNELKALRHKLDNVKFELTETVSNLYIKAYVNQEKISFTTERLDMLENTLTRNKARVMTGEASQNDVDKMEQEKEKLESDLSLLKRQFETSKTKLTDLMKLDVSTGFTFQNAFVTASLDRSMLAGLTEYTLENDQGYYETKLDASLGKISLELNESLIRKEFGSKMGDIQPYITQAKQGQEVDGDLFKAAYDVFLEKIDKPWKGNIWILFIRIPKEWFKGAISGIRYVQDEPYALYTAAMEYEELRITRENAEKELRTQVSDSFEAVITGKNAYDVLAKTLTKLQGEVQKGAALNQTGKMTYQELAALQEEYESTQMDTLDALSAYSELLFSFDKLTCGGITKYLEEGSFESSISAGGDSYLVEEEAEGAYYYIESKIEDNLFEFGVYIPDDYSVNVTHYELWVDGTMIGKRTKVSAPIRHLTLAMNGIEEASIRFYAGDAFVDECTFDPMVTKGELKINAGYRTESGKEEREAASYSCRKTESGTMTEFVLNQNPGEDIAYYQLVDSDGTSIYKDVQIKEGSSFRYLSFLAGDASLIKVKLFDKDKKLLYTGRLNPDTLKVLVKE